MKSLDTVASDIYGLLEGRSIADPSVAQAFGEETAKILAVRLAAKAEEREPALRMSNVGRPLRQLWYEMNGYKGEEQSGKTRFKFLYGDLIEALTLALIKATGHTVERMQEEIDVDGIKGHIDAVIDGELADVKSCSPFGYRKFKEAKLWEDDPFGYVGQLSGYRHAIRLPARFIAVDKVHGDICTLSLPEDIQYDVQRTIHRARQGILTREPPERCYEPKPVSKTDKSGNRILGVGCSYCRWKEECWKTANQGEGLKVFQYSTGPKFFVHINKTPRVAETRLYQEFDPVEEEINE